MSPTETLERTAIIAYALIQELHHVLTEGPEQDLRRSDDILLGIVLATAMFCDETIGPFRSGKIMRTAPEIVLKADAHVTEEDIGQHTPALRAFCQHVEEISDERQGAGERPEAAAA